MSLRLLMDVHIPAEITERLRAAGVEVLTAQEDGSDRLSDDRLIDRAAALGFEIFTNDNDFLVLAANRQKSGLQFGCIFFARQDNCRCREYAEWLEAYCTLESPPEVRNRVIFIP